jgi:hypothetical protein
MINTNEACHIAEILFKTGPITEERVSFVCREVINIPDAIRVNATMLKDHLNGYYWQLKKMNEKGEK